MTKDIEWLKDEILTDMRYLEGNREIRQLDIKYQTLRNVAQKINQLDEPEVLSLDWIDENEVFIFDLDDDCEIRYVPSLKLRHLLVPKQELPVIPKFVAEFLIGKEDYMLYELFDDEWLYEEHDRVAKWLYDNDELTNKQREIDLVMARDRGYTVEEEQKYNVKFKVKSSSGTVGIFLYKIGDEVLAGDNFRAYYPKEDKYRLTEQEIRDFQNGDILFEHFAVKVEELEE